MNEITNNSLFCRAFLGLCRVVGGWWRAGALHRFNEWLKSMTRCSLTYRLWLALGAMPNQAGNSRYARLLRGLRVRVERLGPILESSLFFRLLSAVKRGWLWLVRRSSILSCLARFSPYQWLLAAFAMYLPIEYLLRDALQIALLSSVWEELFIILGVVTVFWRRALRRTPVDSLERETPIDGWMLLFFAVGFLLMCLVCPRPNVAWAGYRIVVEYMLWFFILSRLIENDKDLNIILCSLLALTVFLALHGMYQFAIGVEMPAHWTTSTEADLRTRVFSLTGSPNILGAMMVMLAPLAAAGVYYCRRGWVKVLSLGLVGCCLLTLLFTYSRGAWFGMIITVFFFALIVDKRLIALMGTAMALMLAFIPSITNRIIFMFSPEFAAASAVGGRTMRWSLGWSLLEGHEWFGFGLGRYGGAVAMENRFLDITADFPGYFYMDNYYLKTLVEMGYVGLICYCLLLAALVFCGIRAIQRSDVSLVDIPGDPVVRAIGNKRVLAAALLSGLLGVLAHCFFENIFEEPYMSAYFWGMAAMLIYLGFFRKKPQEDSL